MRNSKCNGLCLMLMCFSFVLFCILPVLAIGWLVGGGRFEDNSIVVGGFVVRGASVLANQSKKILSCGSKIRL